MKARTGDARRSYAGEVTTPQDPTPQDPTHEAVQGHRPAPATLPEPPVVVEQTRGWFMVMRVLTAVILATGSVVMLVQQTPWSLVIGPPSAGGVVEWRPFGLAGLLALILLIVGPQPRLATKWAWFWLAGIGQPVWVLFLVLEPVPLWLKGPAVRSGSRLTGGWAFLLAIVLGLAMSAFFPWWSHLD